MNEPETEPVGLRESMAIKSAVQRGELWASMGYPVSKPHMPQHEYDHDYRGRIWFTNEHVMDQAQLALRIILCPNCVETKRGISATRFYTTIEDDVMTVFPAVGHFLCHHCGFEEYAPLKGDPRARAQNQHAMEASMLRGMSVKELQKYFEVKQQQAADQQAREQKLMSPHDYRRELARRAGVKLPGIGIGGIHSEEEALRRLYESQRLGYAGMNPPVVNPMIKPNKPIS